MIDEIFEMIMKEARTRKGKDLILNINHVWSELSTRVMTTMEKLREQERRENHHER